MKLGGFGFFKQDGILHLPKNITESLALNDKCILFGVYYPPSEDYKDPNISYINDHDFVFSTIPFTDWPFSARFTIRVKKQSFAFNKLTNFFSVNNVTVVHASSTRSGHRFSTIDFHVVFESLKENYNIESFNIKKSYYQPTFDILHQMKKLMINTVEIHDALFIDEHQIYLEDPISEKINQALHYYFWKSNQKLSEEDKVNKELFSIYKPFTLRFVEGEFLEGFDRVIPNSGGKTSSIIYYANKKENVDEPIAPSIVFVESDTNALHLRIRVIPQKKASEFLQLEISHQRYGTPASTKGLFAQVMNNIIAHDEFKIWSFYTQLYECRPEFGAGKLTFFVESKLSRFNFDNETYLKLVKDDMQRKIDKLNNLFKSEEGEKLGLNHVIINEPVLIPLRNSLSKKFYQPWPLKPTFSYDVFLSYAHDDRESLKKIEEILHARGVKCYSADDKIETGRELQKEVFTNIRNCREFCLVYTPNCDKSNWILYELSAALALGKEVSFILVETSFNGVRQEIKTLATSKLTRRTNKIGEIEKYASELLSRRYMD